MKTVIRLDRSAGELKSPTTTSQGFLRCDGYPARAGIYKYRREDGSIQYERRPHEEVFHADSLASYDDAPLTLEHPAEGEVTADNVRRHEVGSVKGAARQDGDLVASEQIIKDAKAIKLVKAGKQQLSPGYKIEFDATPGYDSRYATSDNPTGRYDGTQRKIRVNHLAIVDNARGGSAMRLRMDAAEMVLDFDGETRTDAPIDSLGTRSSGIVASMHADRAEQHARESQSAASRGDARGAEDHAAMSSEHAVHATDAANISGTAAGHAAARRAHDSASVAAAGLGRTSDMHRHVASSGYHQRAGDAMRSDAALDAKERHALSASDFAVPDKEGMPINDEEHVRAAMSRFGQYDFTDAAEKKSAYGRIVRKAKALDIDSSGFEDKWKDRLDSVDVGLFPSAAFLAAAVDSLRADSSGGNPNHDDHGRFSSSGGLAGHVDRLTGGARAHAADKSVAATSATANAYKASQSGHREANLSAAQAHREAAGAHRQAGNHAAASEHEGLAASHAAAADAGFRVRPGMMTSPGTSHETAAPTERYVPPKASADAKAASAAAKEGEMKVKGEHAATAPLSAFHAVAKLHDAAADAHGSGWEADYHRNSANHYRAIGDGTKPRPVYAKTRGDASTRADEASDRANVTSAPIDHRRAALAHRDAAILNPPSSEMHRIRADAHDRAADRTLDARADSCIKLTTVVDGHQHSVDLDPQYGSRYGGSTSYSVSTNESSEHGHCHDWVRNMDGTITIGMAEGHTHDLIDTSGAVGFPSTAALAAASDSATGYGS